MLHKLSTLALTAVMIGALTTAYSQDNDPWSKRVTMKAQDELLADVFQRLFAEAKMTYRLTPEAAKFIAGTHVTTNLQDVPMRTAVQALTRTAASGGGLLIRAGAGPQVNRQLVPKFEKDACVIEVVETILPPRPPVDNGPGRTPITYTAKDVPALRVLTDMLDRLRTGYRIHPDLRKALSSKSVHVSFENVPLTSAMTLLFADLPPKDRTVSYFFDEDHGYYVFAQIPQVPVRDISDVKLSPSVVDEPATLALKRLLESAKVDYAFSPPDVGDSKVNVTLVDAPLQKCVKLYLRSASLQNKLQVGESGGVVGIYPIQSGNGGPNREVTAHFKDVDIKYAIKALMRVSGADYTIDPMVCGSVTADFDNVPMREALEKVLKNVTGPFTISYRLESGIFNIAPNKDYEKWK